MNIRVCIPFYSEFKATKPGLRELLSCKEFDFFIEPRQGSVPRRTRNSLINDSKSQILHQHPVHGFEYFLMIDSDISFKLSDVLTLLSHEKEIICAPYKMHGTPDILDCGSFKPSVPGSIAKRYTTLESGLKKIDWAGAGFMLMHSSVFSKMEYPWYRQVLVKEGNCQEETSEDIGLSLNAKNHNIDLWCDFDVKIGHAPRNHQSFNWDVNEGVALAN